MRLCSLHSAHMSIQPTFRFRTFLIYKNAITFRSYTKRVASSFPVNEKFGLVSQIERAATSVVLNIAEGSSKKSDKDFARFLEISIASVNEIVAAFDCALHDNYIGSDQMITIEQSVEKLAKQIGGFIRSLRNTKKLKSQ